MTPAIGVNRATQPLFRLRSLPRNAFGMARPVPLPWFVKLLLTYLAAITIIGKGPTYLGVPPLYWGELTMAAGLLLIAPEIKRTTFIKHTNGLTLSIAIFMMVGAAITMVSLPRWGMDALRDAAIWYYGLFYFVGLGLAAREGMANRVWYLLRCFWMWALVWNTADLISMRHLSQWGPIVPGRGVPLFFNGVHEAGQNLALGAIIVLCTSTLRRRPKLGAFLIPIAVVGLALFAASEGRGMRIGVASGTFAVLLLSLRPGQAPHFNTRLLKLVVAAIPVLVLAVVALPDRALSITHVDRFAEADPTNPEGTAAWRMIWWQRIYEQVMKRDPRSGLDSVKASMCIIPCWRIPRISFWCGLHTTLT